jgi:hypothetical protein
MKYDRIVEFAARCRARMSQKGCGVCRKRLRLGLFLRGTPSLSVLVRGGAQPRELKEAMRGRGWYCRKCISKKRLSSPFKDPRPPADQQWERDQFATPEESWEFQYWRLYGYEKFEETYKRPYVGKTLGVIHQR